MLTAFCQRELVERARDAGAMAYLVKPFPGRPGAAIEMAVAGYAEMTALEAEVADLEERLETRKLVERAKGAPPEEPYGLTEPEAFRWIQKAVDGPPAEHARGGRDRAHERPTAGRLTSTAVCCQGAACWNVPPTRSWSSGA